MLIEFVGGGAWRSRAQARAYSTSWPLGVRSTGGSPHVQSHGVGGTGAGGRVGDAGGGAGRETGGGDGDEVRDAGGGGGVFGRSIGGAMSVAGGGERRELVGVAGG